MYLIRTNPRSALLQRRRFDSALRPSPTFRGFSPASIASSLAAIPRLILPRSAGRLCPQRPFPSPSFSYHRRVAAALTLAFLNWSHSDASPRTVPLRVAALPLAAPRALPALFSLLREHAPLVSTVRAHRRHPRARRGGPPAPGPRRLPPRAPAPVLPGRAVLQHVARRAVPERPVQGCQVPARPDGAPRRTLQA
ncbi:pentatricopeptide repeat-containing protein [Hordeum vulgare]|nr:pentatricopeptide repeat-containing protein [Hordeum vulgare]